MSRDRSYPPSPSAPQLSDELAASTREVVPSDLGDTRFFLPESTGVAGSCPVPALIASAGEHASRRFLEFFTVTIRNRNTREAYARARAQFLAWCGARRFELAHH